MSEIETKATPVVTKQTPEPVLERCEQCGHYARIVAYGCCEPCIRDVEREARQY